MIFTRLIRLTGLFFVETEYATSLHNANQFMRLCDTVLKLIQYHSGLCATLWLNKKSLITCKLTLNL